MEKELAVLEADLEEKKLWDFAEGVRGEYEREKEDGCKTALWAGGVSLRSYSRQRRTDRLTVTRNIPTVTEFYLCIKHRWVKYQTMKFFVL